MDLYTGPPPGLPRPKTSPPPLPTSLPSLPSGSQPNVASPVPRRATAAPWASSLAAGLFPASFPSFPPPPQVPHGLLPSDAAVQSVVRLYNNDQITDLNNGLQVPTLSDPWHRAHARVCAHALASCAACSIALFCCTCRALRLTPGPPPASPSAVKDIPRSPVLTPRHSWSSSPVFFRDIGNGTPPSFFDDDANDTPDDDAYIRALVESDTCDNSNCPRGDSEPATWTITVEQFDEGLEEMYDRTYRACAACNRACKRSFLGHRIKARTFDNSAKQSDSLAQGKVMDNTPSTRRAGPIPGSAAYAREHPVGDAQSRSSELQPPPRLASSSVRAQTPTADTAQASPVSRTAGTALDGNSLEIVTELQNALRTLAGRPPTPAVFVAIIRVKHNSSCSHPVDSCEVCSHGLVCCSCHALFTPAVSRHLSCAGRKHIASACCTTAFCCTCNKMWLPTDSITPISVPARHFYGGAGSNSSPEPDIWTPSPRSSPDEIDDLTARANIPLPTSRSESDTSRAPSRASSVDDHLNVVATPLPTPDFSALMDDDIDGFMHPSFPDRAILDPKDKRHFLGRGDLAVASLKLYARRIFSETSHWITAGHFLIDIFQGVTLNGSRDDFRRFVILIGTQLGFGDLALSMSECLDVNRKMADEYMRLREVATTWKQKVKANNKDAKNGWKAQDELTRAQNDIAAILEERDIFIKQRQELLVRDDQLSTELSRVHRDYSAAIDDNTKFAADIDVLQEAALVAKKQSHELQNQLSMAEHHRNKAEFDCEQAIFSRDKAIADLARDKAFYEARIVALSSTPVPTSQPDSEAPIRPTDAERTVLLTRIENLKKELSTRDTELAKLRSEVSLSDDVNTLRTELAEARAVSARLSGMYEQKSKDFRESELERLTLLGKQIIADGEAPKSMPPTRPRPASRRGRQRSRSSGRAETTTAAPRSTTPAAMASTPASSQPFWQDEPLFTKHVAAVTTATMSALPHLPFETAIASAFTTVRNVGPPPPLKLDKRPNGRRSGAPSSPTPASAAASGNFTFADMVKAASAKDNSKKEKPTWRAIETSKALVLRPSTKGTRVSELHLKIPKTAELAELFRLKGTALLDRVAKLVSDHSEPAPRMALRENPLVFVKWSMKGNLVLKCAKPMDDVVKEGIKDALTYFFPSPSAEILILNKPPTTALKFLAVPRHNLDSSDTDEMDLLNDLTAHPAWANTELWANPKFINLRSGMAGATVVVSVVDDNQGNVGRRLMGTMVNFSGCMRPCKRWVELPAQPFCGQCQSWGHPGARCPANILICARCGGMHDFRQHDRYCETCKKGPGHACTPFCRNCHGNHMSTSHECPFWLGHTSKERHVELYAEIEAKFPKETRNPQKGITRNNAGPKRKKVDFSKPDAEGFVQVGASSGIAHIDAVPSPSPPPSVKPQDGSIMGIIADEALRPELRGNDEARRLMQETLLDEAAFAAADAVAPTDPSGSPPTSLSYA
ncbi:hypothetical protein AX14_014498 [Amanita brunnescens Koide BX004]|nr:hypothetical protein AX14_014498 [Amanita brunnescens Koide BX004]